MAGFAPSFSMPTVNASSAGGYGLRYYGSEETFDRLPGAIINRGLVDKVDSLEVENAELRETVANLRTENCQLRKRLLQEMEKRGKCC